MSPRQQTGIRTCSAAYTLIEVLEAVAAIALGVWLADAVSSHFDGAWREFVLWTIRIAGSGIIFLFFLFGFGYLFDCLQRRKPPKATDGTDTHNAA